MKASGESYGLNYKRDQNQISHGLSIFKACFIMNKNIYIYILVYIYIYSSAFILKDTANTLQLKTELARLQRLASGIQYCREFKKRWEKTTKQYAKGHFQ